MVPRLIAPISINEFATMMREVTPPPGWGRTLAVGNSGGPDSTCLLFLLARHLKGHQATTSLPERLVSISINHDLQASSGTMANQAAKIADSLGIHHVTVKLPWGQGHHPQKPGPDDHIEERARDMRQLVLFEHMMQLGANSLAFGHHADDQVETMLMRMGRGSSGQGLAGMRPCRRWGMGSRTNGSRPHALEGMRKWIVRPLLGVGKDRILATCESEQLHFVTDPTNFQPQLTIRNAIRHVLRTAEIASFSAGGKLASTLPPNIVDGLCNIKKAVSRVTEHSSLQDLSKLNRSMVIVRSNIEKSVDEALQTLRLPSPPGTFMIPLLSLQKITDDKMLEALLYRVTRYISPRPWGHPQAELGRRKASIRRLTKHLYDAHLHPPRNGDSVCVGSEVWWRLAKFGQDRISFDVEGACAENLAWTAVRQPPPSHNINPLSNNSHCALTLDITEQIIRQSQLWAAQMDSDPMEILYDNRFILSICVGQIPGPIVDSLRSGDSKMLVRSTRPWSLPEIVCHKEDSSEQILHSDVLLTHGESNLQQGCRKPRAIIRANWVTIQYFRPISNI